MAAMLSSNAPKRARRRKSLWARLFGKPDGAAPPPKLPSPALPAAAAAQSAPPAPLSAPMPTPAADMPADATPGGADRQPEADAARPAADAPPEPEIYGPPPPPAAAAIAASTRPAPRRVEPDPIAPAPHAATQAAPTHSGPTHSGPTHSGATHSGATEAGTHPAAAPAPQMQAPQVVVAAPPARPRVGWFLASVGWTLRLAVAVLLVAGILGLAAWPVWRESERIDVEVMPIAVPAALAERGLVPEVAATRLVDALNDTLARVTENARNRPTKDDIGAIPAITATREGLSLRRMASLVREWRGLPVRRIAGEVTLGTDGRLSVRLRVPGSASFATAHAPAGADLDQALAMIAPDVWRRLNPLVYAWHVADGGGAEDLVRPRLVALAQDFRLPPAVELRVTVLYARSLVRSGRAAEAIATIEDIERRAPTYPLLWNVKAQALADLNRIEPALEAQRQAVVHEGTTVWSHISSAHLLMRLGRAREALTDLQSARRLAPNNFDAVMLESMALLSLGRPAESLVLINRVIEARPNLPGAQEARGNALLANNRPEEAIAAFDEEIARNPFSLTVRLARANALRALRRPQEALAAIDEILRLAPRDGMANVLRGWSILELGQHDQALAIFEMVLRDRPNDVPALHGRGIALALLGRRAEAIGALNRAMELQPGNRRIAAELARLRGVAPPAQGSPPAPPQGGTPARP